MSANDIARRAAIMTEVITELERQDGKWGVQNHDIHYWNTIITEELGESAEAALELTKPDDYAAAQHYTTELVHVAACAIQAIETLRRQNPQFDPSEARNDGSARAKEAALSGVSKPYMHAFNCDWPVNPCTCHRSQVSRVVAVRDDPDDFDVTLRAHRATFEGEQ